MQTKQVYQTDSSGRFIGIETSYASPLESGVWLIPSGCVEKTPPHFDPATQYAQWNGMNDWEVKEIPIQPEVVTPDVLPSEPTEAELMEQEIQAELRQMAIERIAARKANG